MKVLKTIVTGVVVAGVLVLLKDEIKNTAKFLLTPKRKNLNGDERDQNGIPVMPKNNFRKVKKN